MEFLRNRLTTTPIMSRKIEINDSLNKNKLFNYILQAVETERNILILDKLHRLDMGQQSIPILYTYDSILFDVHPDDENDILEVKKVMEMDGFPTELEIGVNYGNMVKSNI